MYLSKSDLESLEKVKRLNIVNAITGIKPANLVGTISDQGENNLAIISSVVHLGSNPALIGFIMRPTETVPRHTYENIMQNGSYTINHVHESFVKNAHYTSAKFERIESEFEHCEIEPEFREGFKAPFVKNSPIKIGMKFLETIPIKLNGTIMIIGEISHLMIHDQAIDDQGKIDLSKIGDVGISGLDTYYRLNKICSLPFARVSELPKF